MKLGAELIGYVFVSACISGTMALFSYPCLYEAFKGREIESEKKSGIALRVASGAVGVSLNFVGAGLDYILIASSLN